MAFRLIFLQRMNRLSVEYTSTFTLAQDRVIKTQTICSKPVHSVIAIKKICSCVSYRNVFLIFDLGLLQPKRFINFLPYS